MYMLRFGSHVCRVQYVNRAGNLALYSQANPNLAGRTRSIEVFTFHGRNTRQATHKYHVHNGHFRYRQARIQVYTGADDRPR